MGLGLPPPTLELYTDGSSTGKVGEGGWAFVLLDEGAPTHEAYGGADETTNNRMELSGVIEGLRYIYKEYLPTCKIVVYSDSQYVVNGITKWFSGWEKKIAKGKTIKNQDLWFDLKELTDLFSDIDFQWVRGHSGVEHNERCDILAKQGKLEIKRANDETRQL